MAEAKKENHVLRARNTVINDLIAAHEDEYHDRMEKACADLGVVYSRPLSAEQKAANDIKALLDKFPHLAVQFGTTGAVAAEAPTKEFSTGE